MKRLLALALVLLVAAPALADDVWSGETFGVQTTIPVALKFQNSGAVDLKTDATCEAGDVKIMKDTGDEANATNCFVDEGSGYSITLTATEMTAQKITLYIVDQSMTKAWEDKVVQISTALTEPTAKAQAGGPRTITLASTAPAASNVLRNNLIYIPMGTGFGQSRCITRWNGTTKVATVDQRWDVEPDSTSYYVISPNARCASAARRD